MRTGTSLLPPSPREGLSSAEHRFCRSELTRRPVATGSSSFLWQHQGGRGGPGAPHGPGRTSHGRRRDRRVGSVLPGAGAGPSRLGLPRARGLGSAGGPGKGGSGLGGLAAAALEERKSNSGLTFGSSINSYGRGRGGLEETFLKL